MLTFRSITMVTAFVVLTAILLVRRESFAVPAGKWPALIAASAMNILIWDIASRSLLSTSLGPCLGAVLHHAPLGGADRLPGFRPAPDGPPARPILIGATAVLALMLPNFESYERAPAGLFWGLFAGFCWAVGTFIVKRTARPGMGLSLTFWQIVISLPPILLGALVIDGIPDQWPSARALTATIYTGAIPMALGTATWFALVKLLPAQVAALSSIAIPIVAIVSGVLLLNEPLSALQTVAIGSTVVALWLALMPGKER